MSRVPAWILSAVMLVPAASPAQVSPGRLSRAHEQLEGITHCTDCHERGEQIGMHLCLVCHTDIKASIGRGTGLHAASKDAGCETCHKEHLGVDAAITQFDRSTFSHPSTGFTLTGGHRTLECERCHRAENIRLQAVRSFRRSGRTTTFLGLERRCASCHADRHAGTMSSDCATCHTTERWKPATAFNHATAKFPLTGKHLTVDCFACHPRPVRPDAPRLFSAKPFDTCTPCHTSPHPPKFGGGKECQGCHTTEGWKAVGAFDHSVTRFALLGRHATVPCATCHPAMSRATADMKVKFAAQSFSDCTPCHVTPHGPGFAGRRCSTCHTPQSWSDGDRSAFDHRMTRFVLTGAHARVDCVKCHGRTTTQQPFTTVFRTGPRPCSACHKDPHGGVFVTRYGTDCSRCHNERAFVPATFTSAMHDSSSFALTGAHNAVPCGACHRPQGATAPIFRLASTRCDACHVDRHRGQFAKQMAANSCAQCHATTSWNTRSFDHSGTGFPLTGRHAAAGCESCHRPDRRGVVQYAGTPSACIDCHPDVHRGQFVKNGTVECRACHTPTGWTDLTFRHDTQSSFALTGAHRSVACGGCHRPERAGDTLFVRFKPLSAACESCHRGKT